MVVIWCEPDIERIHSNATRVSAMARRLWEQRARHLGLTKDG